MNPRAGDEIKKLLATSEPAELGPGPRPGVLSEAEINATLDAGLNSSGLAQTRQQLIRALILLWHDHLDASHKIAQAIENSDGSFVHAIMHRREPDFWNSKYWWRRVGNHPAFPKISRAVGRLLDSQGETALAKKILPCGKWDAAAFVDVCESAGPNQKNLLRQIQRAETEVLLEYFLTADE